MKEQIKRNESNTKKPHEFHILIHTRNTKILMICLLMRKHHNNNKYKRVKSAHFFVLALKNEQKAVDVRFSRQLT